jgi:hypothetical protein
VPHAGFTKYADDVFGKTSGEIRKLPARVAKVTGGGLRILLKRGLAAFGEIIGPGKESGRKTGLKSLGSFALILFSEQLRRRVRLRRLRLARSS